MQARFIQRSCGLLARKCPVQAVYCFQFKRSLS